MLRFKTDEGIEFPNCKRMKMKDIFVEIIDKKTSDHACSFCTTGDGYYIA